MLCGLVLGRIRQLGMACKAVSHDVGDAGRVMLVITMRWRWVAFHTRPC